MEVLPRRGHVELVMHVLAHVRATAHLPASVYDRTWVALAEGHLGPAKERTLAEDADALGRLIRSHDELAQLQGYAALFDEPEDDPCRELGRVSGARPALVACLSRLGPALELLRCAVALERPLLSRLPAPTIDRDLLAAAFDRVMPAAPTLPRHAILIVPALVKRGRLFEDEIWIGDPGGGLVSVDHVAWQAAHEATVGELARARPRLSERAVEEAALSRLAARAEIAGLAAPHAAWRAQLRV